MEGTTITCPNGHENPAGREFCSECGESLRWEQTSVWVVSKLQQSDPAEKPAPPAETPPPAAEAPPPPPPEPAPAPPAPEPPAAAPPPPPPPPAPAPEPAPPPPPAAAAPPPPPPPPQPAPAPAAPAPVATTPQPTVHRARSPLGSQIAASLSEFGRLFRRAFFPGRRR